MNTQKLIPLIFAFTLFISAMLVFSVQPMLGKMMLPHVGGSPSGWAVTMFFFQTCLLFGYGLAYLFSKLPPFLNTLAILLIFLPAALFLPIAYHTELTDSISPWAVFIQLTASTAVPFLALSTLSPGLQRLFSFSGHKTANDPYYLYAASNLGSFVGLLAYPIILEPLIGLKTQSHFWMMCFSMLFILVLVCASLIFIHRRDLINFKFTMPKIKSDEQPETITWRRRFQWLILAAIPSSLMVGTTTQISTDIASAPMLWVIPLSLYLLTNIWAFAKRDTIKLDLFSVLHILSAVMILYFAVTTNYKAAAINYTYFIAIGYIVAFTITAFLLHSRLANDRPKIQHLTQFYFIMALGGAIGGSFNAFIAPNIFNDVYECQFVFIISLMLNPAFYQKLLPNVKKLSAYIIIAIIICLAILGFKYNDFTFAALLFLILLSAMTARSLFVVSILIFAFLISPFSQKSLLHSQRNFYGVLKVDEIPTNNDKSAKIRALYHGTTMHGFQALDEKHAFIPYSYYGENGPVGDVMKLQNPKDIAVLGLGVGQTACYKKPGREFTFYEIDKDVVDVAKKYFQILEKCGYKDIIIGDARLELAKTDNRFDMVMVDTFSSDSIPMHLITQEAIEIYMSKIKNDGLVLINISNRYLNLKPALSSISKKLGYIFVSRIYIPEKDDTYNLASEWVVITKNKKTAQALENKEWEGYETSIRPWTDDYSNFISTLRIFAKEKPKESKQSEDKE